MIVLPLLSFGLGISSSMKSSLAAAIFEVGGMMDVLWCSEVGLFDRRWTWQREGHADSRIMRKAAQKGGVTLEPSRTFAPFRAFSGDDFVRSKNSCWITTGNPGSWQKKVSQVKYAFFDTV
jgi:hypothetical protein